VIQRKAVEGTLIEFEVMSKMTNSPFVLQLHYAFQDLGTLYLVTDLCEGGSLDQLVRKEKHLSEKPAVFLFAELILALAHLHKLGVVHMDVKLANCLLDVMGHLKLADFNGAVQFKSSLDKFEGKSYFGTSGYLSPEILIMETGFTVCSPDWWSAGICFWTMLHGKKSSPWLDKRRRFRTWEQELQVIVNKRRPNIGPHVSPEAADLISRLLRLDWRTRLGCGKDGSREIMQHSLFSSLDWDFIETGEANSTVRPQAAAFSVENSEKTADKWIRDTLQTNLLNDLITAEEQQLFTRWNFDIDESRSQPEFATLNTFAALDIKQARAWCAKCDESALCKLKSDIKKLQNRWIEVMS